MKTVAVYFSNHFDLTWRRCWERETVYQGNRYASYQRIEELCLERNLALAERGEGAYIVEQGLTMRAFLAKHPAALPRLKTLYGKGLFEMCGAGEAIIDINLCSFETMCRNLASGVDYCRNVLGMPPLLACHDDGFGSSAQFPQVIRLCGLPGIQGLSYSLPDNTYWRGLDGSTILVWKGAPGRSYFFDHCYHEPCRACRGNASEACRTCQGTGLDLPQNFYPPFERAPASGFSNGQAQYVVKSEEMLPPEGFSKLLRQWEAEEPDIHYVWATPRRLAALWQPLVTVHQPPADQLSSRVENNPVQTGCYVSRIRIKQESRHCESLQYGWETALVLTCPQAVDPSAWTTSFLELPLFFFHDAITGTHQDDAYTELMDRMSSMRHHIRNEAELTLRRAGFPTASVPVPPLPGITLQAFSTGSGCHSARIPLAGTAWREATPLVAVSGDGRRWPVVHAWHPWSPSLQPAQDRLISAVGSTARTRPDSTPIFIEAGDLDPLRWQELALEGTAAPTPLETRELRNPTLAVELGDHGVAAIHNLLTGTIARCDDLAALGGLVLEDDTGDPWATRRLPAFCKSLTPFTRFSGILRFEGYSEAYFAGYYEPNMRFGREEDPALFALEWTITVRLLDTTPRVDFEYELFWKSENRRIRAIFPVQAESDSAWYSIPGGILERPRYDQTETLLWSPNGDWPALHYVAARPPAGQPSGWAIINHGTPSSRAADGRIQVSLLRSPGFGHCLERYAQNYPMPTHGIRNGGWHHFTLSFVPHAGEHDMGRLAREAAALNMPVPAVAVPAGSHLPAAPFHISGDAVQLMAAKFPFNRGQEQIIRIMNPQACPATISLESADGNPVRITPCLLTEEDAGESVSGTRVSVVFRPFEVKTFRIMRQGVMNED